MLNDDFKGFLLSRGVLYAALLAAVGSAVAANYQCYVLSCRLERIEDHLFLQYRFDINRSFTLQRRPTVERVRAAVDLTTKGTKHTKGGFVAGEPCQSPATPLLRSRAQPLSGRP